MKNYPDLLVQNILGKKIIAILDNDLPKIGEMVIVEGQKYECIDVIISEENGPHSVELGEWNE